MPTKAKFMEEPARRKRSATRQAPAKYGTDIAFLPARTSRAGAGISPPIMTGLKSSFVKNQLTIRLPILPMSTAHLGTSAWTTRCRTRTASIYRPSIGTTPAASRLSGESVASCGGHNPIPSEVIMAIQHASRPANADGRLIHEKI